MGVFAQHGPALEWRGGHETVRVEPRGPSSLRMRGTIWQGIRDDLPGALLPAPATRAAVEISGDRARITNGALTAEISAAGRLRFTRTRDGAELLAEVRPHFTGPPARRYGPASGGLHRFEALVAARDGERLYGMGQHQHDRLDQKGAVIDLVQRNTEVFARETESARPRATEYGADYPQVSQASWTAIQAAITGTATPAAALAQAQSTISGIPQVRHG